MTNFAKLTGMVVLNTRFLSNVRPSFQNLVFRFSLKNSGKFIGDNPVFQLELSWRKNLNTVCVISS